MRRLVIAAALILCAAAPGSAQDIPLSKILIEGESWKLAAKELPGITFLEGTPNGISIYQGRMSTRLHLNGKLEPLPPPPGFDFHSCSTVSTGRTVYCADAKDRSIKTLTIPSQVLKMGETASPTCLTLWPGGEQLVIGDGGGKYLWTALIKKGGELDAADRYYSLSVKPGEQASGVTCMTMDAGNLLYACTPLGVQVFDPTGRLCGVIHAPAKDMTAITLGGEKGDTLYVACGEKIYSRKIQGKAVYTLKKGQ